MAMPNWLTPWPPGRYRCFLNAAGQRRVAGYDRFGKAEIASAGFSAVGGRPVSYFSSTRNEREVKAVSGNAAVNGKIEQPRPAVRNNDDISTIGSGMAITGNI